MPSSNSSIPAATNPATLKDRFWETKSLTDMNPAEWEALCDGCGWCCIEKWEDEDTGEIAYTSDPCTLLNTKTCQCKNYAQRQQYVPQCLKVTPELLANDTQRGWLPPTCAYRLLAEGEHLLEWHPLVSGDPHSVAKAGMSAKSILRKKTRWPL